ncbi:DEAD-box ATP-dependent RNA helicase 53-like [Papaver somniferum]|uniref:DEAD-box ATP-dependent RNA helicase 53-like n=1 Tax=Papaver somniferum TaxID=3469 RepID=UPI000E6FB8CE|nr:DEAD-box ATP-dependent RNA helicase 53-like [Papaver somniferum]
MEMVDKGIKLFKIEAPMEGRESVSRSLIKGHANSGSTIVFTDSQTEANQLASVFKCEALKGGKRRDTLLRFHDGEFDLLFASDDVALGIDFPRVELVIHLEPPRNSEIFLARSSLAGNQGTAILIYSEKETEQTQEIQRKLWCNNIKTIHMIVGERGNNKMTLVRKVIGPGDGLGGKGVVHLVLKLVRSFLTPKPGLRVLFGFGGCFLVYFSFWFLRCHSGGEN